MTTLALLAKQSDSPESSAVCRAIVDLYLEWTENVYEKSLAEQRESKQLFEFLIADKPNRIVNLPRDSDDAEDKKVLILGTPIPQQSFKTTAVNLIKEKFVPFNGPGALVVFDTDRVLLQLDSLGIFQLYMSRGPHGTAISNRAVLASALAGNKVEFDSVSLLEMIVTEGNLDGFHPYKHVEALEGNQLISISSDGQFEVLSSPTVDLRSTCSADEAIDELLANVKNAANTYGPLRCKLTGGLDSRLNLALCHSTGVDFDCFTRNHPCPDSHVAIQLTNSLNLPHTVDSSIDQVKIGCIAVSEACSGTWWSTKHSHDEAERLSISGAGGAYNRLHYLQSPWRQPTRSSIREAKHLNGYLSDKRRAILTEDQFQTLALRFEERINNLKTDGISFHQAIDEVYLDRDRTWLGRGTSRSIGHMVCPLFSPRFYQYGRKFSPLARARSMPHRTLTSRLWPELNQIPYLEKKNKLSSRVYGLLPLKMTTRIRRQRFIVSGHSEHTPDAFESSCLSEMFSPWQFSAISGSQYQSKVHDIVETEQYIRDVNRVLSQTVKTANTR